MKTFLRRGRNVFQASDARCWMLGNSRASHTRSIQGEHIWEQCVMWHVRRHDSRAPRLGHRAPVPASWHSLRLRKHSDGLSLSSAEAKPRHCPLGGLRNVSERADSAVSLFSQQQDGNIDKAASSVGADPTESWTQQPASAKDRSRSRRKDAKTSPKRMSAIGDPGAVPLLVSQAVSADRSVTNQVSWNNVAATNKAPKATRCAKTGQKVGVSKRLNLSAAALQGAEKRCGPCAKEGGPVGETERHTEKLANHTV